ncbi:DUF6701 domain-containing protein [Oceanicoccus sagamiensis]|uniref:PA14 domain-containing protein n=1 Tax=Oceanicoccus sagamiensis TaxID=716816 RepID=A0A1X9N917_9GAMM|nr:DUF6701 domain-containing protein [Oceanicoccus sagamiensis]ARN73584.1 hypothetical protein BST96_05290 [Oceanicoccus sagamiensis]
MKRLGQFMPRILFALTLVALALVARADINATYYDQNGVQYDFFTGTEIKTIDANIDFTWGGGEPIAGIPRDDFSVRWEGELEVPADGNYTFRVRGDDGIRIYIDGSLLINDWSNHGPRNRDSSAVAMLAGQRYTILVEHYERGGGAVAQVSWSGPTTGGFQIIPSTFLFAETSPPEVVAAGYGCSADSISITYDSNMDQTTVENIANYALDNGATITVATLEADGRTVTLATSELTEENYLVTINNVENTSGDIIAVDTTTTASFRISGLSATYFDQNNTSGAYFTGFQVEQVDATVDFNWGSGAPVSGIGSDRFSVRWEGFVIASETDNFEFRTRSDDGVRLYIDNVLVIDNWTNHGPRYDYSVAIPMVADQQYAIRMEYYENTGGAVAQLQWQNSSFSWVTIPQSQLLGTCGLPTLQSASFSCSGDTISVAFSEQVSTVTAEDTDNYSINRGVTVNSATLESDGQTVTLETSNLGPVDYLLTVNNIEDSSGTEIEPNSQITAVYQNTGLTATYYDQNNSSRAYFTGNTVTVIEENIDHDWGRNAPVAGIGVDRFSVRWEGYIEPPTDGDYIFRSRSDDGFRLYLDDVEIIDHWSDHSASYRSSATQTLVAGQSYKIVAEFYENGGDAVAQLEWSGPGFGSEIIAPEYFISDCESPTGEWQFEEPFWNGTSGEVLDASGTGNNGTARDNGNGSLPSTSYANPAISGNPGTCRYGEFDGVDDYVEVDAGFANKQQSFTITAWINPVNTDPGSRIFADDESNSQGYAFSVGDPGNGRLRFYSRGVNPISVDTRSSVIRNNRWTHVAAVHDVDNKTRTIYVNGVAQRLNTGGFSSTYTGTWGVDAGPASIGGETNSGETANRFTGAIDEVRFYDLALEADDIVTIYNETHACDDFPTATRFDIDHSNSAIFCAPTVVTVTAENDLDAADLSYNGTITLDTQTGEGNWSLNSGSGSFDNGTDNDGIATYEFTISDNGVASFLLDRSGSAIGPDDDDSIDIDVTDGLITDDDSEGELSFSASGFTISGAVLDNPASSQGIGTQIAGVPFTAFISAYGQTREDPICGVIENYSGTKSLSLTMMYLNPGTGPETITADTTDIDFTQGQGTISLTYKDVGEINFSLAEGVTINGDSNNFVVRPDRFVIEPEGAVADYNGINAYRKAGEDFAVTVTAVERGGDPVSNYGKEADPEGVVLTSINLLPSGGVNGNFTCSDDPCLSPSADPASFSGDFQYDEVGVIRLTAKVDGDNGYLGTREYAETSLDPVGRFTPDHFIVNNISLTPALSSAGFTYLDQPFEVTYTLEARSSNNTTTQNYEGSFSRLPDTDTGVVYSAVDGIETFPARLSSTNTTLTWTKGESYDASATVPVITNYDLTLARLADPDGPFSNTVINLNVTDTDGISLLTADTPLNTTATEFRYGRVFIPPVYGPEIAKDALTDIPLTIEYWADPDGDTNFEFVLNTDDSETDYGSWIQVAGAAACVEVIGPVLCSDISIQKAPDSSTFNAGRSVAGTAAIKVLRPGAGNTGSLTVQFNVDNWLTFNWDTGAAGDEEPSTQINFGQYRGHDRIIYWREALQ